MIWNPDKFRRWSGGVYLATAIGMLIAGLTVLQDRLSGLAFAIYWLICMLLTFLSLMIALLDVRAVRRQSRQQQNDLMRQMISNVERARHELLKKPEPPSSNPDAPAE